MAPRVASLLGWLLFAATGHAATLCVNPGGTGGCFASVQAAVDAAADGDTIAVAAGTYAEHVLIERKRLDVVGDDPTTTLIDGGWTGRPMTVRGPGTRLTLSRLGMQNAGPGFTLIPNVAVSNSKVTISECRLTGSNSAGLADQEDNNIHLHRARLTVIETTIEGNASVGVFLFGQSRLTLIRSTISDNGDSGILVTGKGTRVRVEDSTISGNATTSDGGGIYVVASCVVRLLRSTVASNTAQGLGGGVFADTGSRVRSEATILANNLHMGATPNECWGPRPSGPLGASCRAGSTSSRTAAHPWGPRMSTSPARTRCSVRSRTTAARRSRMRRWPVARRWVSSPGPALVRSRTSAGSRARSRATADPTRRRDSQKASDRDGAYLVPALLGMWLTDEALRVAELDVRSAHGDVAQKFSGCP